MMRRTAQGEEIGTAYQKACINSWKEAGLRIVSLNPDTEIAELEERATGVEFVANGSRGERSKIESLLALIAQSGDRVAGIVNAD